MGLKINIHDGFATDCSVWLNDPTILKPSSVQNTQTDVNMLCHSVHVIFMILRRAMKSFSLA